MCPRIENQSWTPSAGTKAGCEAGDGQARRRREVEALELESRYGQRRQDLLSLLDGLEDRIEPLQEAVRAAAQAHPQARLLMIHPGKHLSFVPKPILKVAGTMARVKMNATKRRL